MNYKAVKFKFQSSLHIGLNSLEDAEKRLMADTLFSAMCIETKNLGDVKLDKLVNLVKTGNIIFSDAFPYREDDYYLPKPMKRIENEEEGNSIVKKAYKKLELIADCDFDYYIKGEYDIQNAEETPEFGRRDIRVAASIRGEEETVPYRVGAFLFNEDCGLYFIFGYKEEADHTFLHEVLDSLSFSGIGGKRASGYGRFVYEECELPESILKRLNSINGQVMTLSVSLPAENELAESVAEAEYQLIKRSGFVTSETYLAEQTRKNDLYVFKAGSCFSQVFKGGVYDVSGGRGSHEVYRYAVPLFMGVDE